MAKRIVKKRKIKFFNLFIFLLILIGIICCVYFVLSKPIKNIIIRNTNYLNDDYIIELAKIKDYPTFIVTNSYMLENRIKKSPYVSKCDVKKRFYNVVEINITEESEITQIDFFPDTGAVPQQMTAFEINMAVITENPLDN